MYLFIYVFIYEQVTIIPKPEFFGHFEGGIP